MLFFYNLQRSICVAFSMLFCIHGFSQADSISTSSEEKKPSKFEQMNAKAEHLFKFIPVPLASYSSEAGSTFGLAKFNLFHLNKHDTISKPSKISGVITFSTKGRINISASNEFIFAENKWIALGTFNFKVIPEYFFGIGNNVTVDGIEEVKTSRLKTTFNLLRQVYPNLYVGPAFDFAYYFDVDKDSNSYIIQENLYGKDGGISSGLGAMVAYDNRDNRYNASKGVYLSSNYYLFRNYFGSDFHYNRFEFDARAYYRPWFKHVIAFQVSTRLSTGQVPFYELNMMGGETEMRGYYRGAFRDKAVFSTQLEYRMPIWKMFGIAAWYGVGRVAENYKYLGANGFRYAAGIGLRIRVDSEHNTNLRLDYGFGPDHLLRGFYISFAEAF